jgi:hypothetical protein
VRTLSAELLGIRRVGILCHPINTIGGQTQIDDRRSAGNTRGSGPRSCVLHGRSQYRRIAARDRSSAFLLARVAALIADLDATRWTGRPGYSIRTMVGMVLVKSLYLLPTWTRTVRLVAEHAALRKAIGGAPVVDACYRFTAKVRGHKGPLTRASPPSSPPCTPSCPSSASTSPTTAPTSPPTPTGSGTCPRAGSCGSASPIATRRGGTVRLSRPARGRVLRLQSARRRLHRYRPSGGMGDAHGPRRRGSRRTVPAGQDR